MTEERDKVRCCKCELVQWSDHERCRRCGASLPQPIVKIVERIVCQPCLSCTSCDSKTERPLDSKCAEEACEIRAASNFPTMAEMERSLILAAYQRSNRRPLEAARLLGIGKTTVYRKLREMKARVA